MNVYYDFFISTLPAAVLVLLLCKTFFRSFSVERSTQWIRIILIVHAFIMIGLFFYLMFDTQGSDSERSFMGVYVFMLLSNTLLPLLLLWKKTGRNLFMLLVIALLVNTGRIMESFVIIATSFHRDHGVFFPVDEIVTITKGIVLGLLMVGLESIMRKHDLKFFRDENGVRLNFTPFVIVVCCAAVYLIGVWRTSLDEFEPPFILYYGGMFLQYIAIMVSGLLILNHLISITKHNLRLQTSKPNDSGN